MPTLIPYPGLTVEGYTNTSTKVADLLLSDFFLSDKDQSFFFREDVASFADSVFIHQKNPTMLCDSVRSSLVKYFSKFFPSVEISVEYKDRDGSVNAYDLYLVLDLTDTEGKRITLPRLLSTENNVITSIMAYIQSES